MREYFLFIDTEASGLPKKWNLPYSKSDNWPYSVQISWIIYKANGQEVKRENHFIGDDDFKINPSAIKIHGITREFLIRNGESRRKILSYLSKDLYKYKPLIVGHFMEFDYHILSADYFRADVKNPLKKLPIFCTMIASKQFVRNPEVKFLRLGELYRTLFNSTLENQHNALIDAEATSQCFFEMVKRGTITDEYIEKQQVPVNIPYVNESVFGWVLTILIILLLIFLISTFL